MNPLATQRRRMNPACGEGAPSPIHGALFVARRFIAVRIDRRVIDRHVMNRHVMNRRAHTMIRRICRIRQGMNPLATQRRRMNPVCGEGAPSPIHGAPFVARRLIAGWIDRHVMNRRAHTMIRRIRRIRQGMNPLATQRRRMNPACL